MLAGAEWMKNALDALSSVEADMNEPMQLAIVGRISSSKSTLVNAILGQPDVVRTDHEVETFNVSWLKYGDNDAPVTVHFKDGSKKQVPKSDWHEWASHGGHETMKSEVGYIEVYFDYEILKRVNIIDTPGLDSSFGTDSENTVTFLRKVHPDAVILMFTRSLTADSLSLIGEFQRYEQSMSFSLNPMNALGVLSKIDLNWKVMNVRDEVQTQKSVIARTLAGHPDVSRSLFRIMPLSAMMGLASCCVTDEDLSDFVSLASMPETDLKRLFFSADSFKALRDDVPVSPEERKRLLQKYGLYGAYVSITSVRSGEAADKTGVASVLGEKSGFREFFSLLVSHFGDRATLIKAQKGMMSLLSACRKDRIQADTAERQELADRLCARVLSIEDELHELKEWSLLMRIYEGKSKVDSEFLEEFLRLCGECGYAAVDRLDMDSSADVSEMIEVARGREAYWRAKSNVIRRISMKKAEPFSVLSGSYEILAERLAEQQAEYEKARRIMAIYEHFVYGK